MRVKFLRDVNGVVQYKRGDIKEINPWVYDHPMKKEGYIIVCHGQGIFSGFMPNKDVEILHD